MATTVEIGFDLAPNGIGDWFTLNDATKGALDNTTYVLSGDVLTDVTTKVRSVNVKRGRSRQLERFTASTCQVVLDNRDRAFDPLHTSSPYYGNIGPRKALRISTNGLPIWRGNVEDWDYNYDLGGDSTATTKGVDGFAILARTPMPAGTMTSELTGARVSSVLSSVGWDATQTVVDAGMSTLDADVVAGDVNVLAYLQKVEISEPGALFMGTDGAVTFRDKGAAQAFTLGATFGSGGIPFEDFSVVFGTEEQWNKVNVTYYGGTAVAGTATASGTASIAQYGTMDTTYDTLLASSADALALATYQVQKFADPRWRVDTITVNTAALTAAQLATVLALDLADVVKVTWTPNGIGAAIEQYVTIDGIEHSISPAVHRVTFTLSETQAAFLLDDAVFGRLDFNTLGF